MKRLFNLKRKWILLLIPVSILFILICRRWAFVAEYVFGRVIYKATAVAIGAVTRWFPFSLAEIIIYIIPIAVITLLVLLVRRVIKNKGERLYHIGKAVLNIGCFVSIAIFMFVILCGMNYYRYSFMEYLDYDVKEYTEEDLYELCLYLVDKVNESRDNISNVDENGVMKLSYESTRDFLNMAEDVMSEFAKDYSALKWSTGGVKPVLASKYMSYTDIVGIYVPFTVEANVNVDTEEYNQPSDAIHELAHLRGIMLEDEANYISYLACVTSKEPDFIYSGYAMAYIYASNQLYDANYDLFEKVYAKLSMDVRRDFAANSAYWRQFDTPVGNTISSVSNKVNDTYLNMNGQEEGTKSYGMVVDLLIAEYKEKVNDRTEQDN